MWLTVYILIVPLNSIFQSFYLVEILDVLYPHVFGFEALFLSMTHRLPFLSHLGFLFFQRLKVQRAAVLF